MMMSQQVLTHVYMALTDIINKISIDSFKLVICTACSKIVKDSILH